jgi:hypothetical protein
LYRKTNHVKRCFIEKLVEQLTPDGKAVYSIPEARSPRKKQKIEKHTSVSHDSYKGTCGVCKDKDHNKRTRKYCSSCEMFVHKEC